MDSTNYPPAKLFRLGSDGARSRTSSSTFETPSLMPALAPTSTPLNMLSIFQTQMQP